MAETLTIGQVAQVVGVNVETIRYYQRLGLLHIPPKCAQGYRQYNQETVRTLKFIRSAKDLAFSLKEIGALLTLHSENPPACNDVKSLAEQKARELDEKHRELTRIRAYLEGLISECSGSEPVRECPIIEALNP